MLRVIGCVVGAIVIILLYEMIGIFAAYKKQPELSEETKQSLHPEDIYTDASVEERACIIEENGNALLQRIRLIEQAKEDIVLSTFAFHDDDSGQIMMGALLRAAECARPCLSRWIRELDGDGRKCIFLCDVVASEYRDQGV